ncbi:MAG: CHASE domain-containing protein [Rhodanobacter sp.]
MKRRAVNPILWSLGLLLLSGAGAIYFAVHAHASNKQQVQSRLEALAHQVADQLQQRFRLYEYGLRGARGAVIAADHEDISNDVFARYMESRDTEHEFPGSRGFGFVARVAPAKIDSFLARVRKEGRRNFTLHELGPNAGDRFIIKFIEPLVPNAEAVGLDIASEKVRRDAAVAAMKSGKATLTGPITLVQASGGKKQSMLLLLPVYQGAQNREPGTRGGALLGWVYTPLVTDDILSSFDQSQTQFGFALSDVTDDANPVPFFSSRMHKTGAADGLSSSERFSVYGRMWRVVIQAQPSFLQSLGLTDPLLGAVWITGSGALLAIMLFVLLTARQRRQRNLAQKARLATIVEDSHDAIIGTSLDGTVTEWNRAASDYFGYSAAEAIGHTVADLIVPARLIKEDMEIMRRAYAGESLATSESVRRHRDGSSLYVEISASPIRDGRGRVVGAAKTIRDITERKQAQRRILELNATLEDQVQRRTAELQSFSALQRAILNNAGYAIIATDPKGIITLFNPAAEGMLGYAASELVGHRVSRPVP